MNTKTHDKNDVGRTEHFYRRILHALELNGTPRDFVESTEWWRSRT